MTKEEIGVILKNARLRANMTQKEASEKISRPQQTLASWEVGKSQPDANTLFLLFDCYGQSLDAAFGYSCDALSRDDSFLLAAFSQLNEEGRERLLVYAQDLVASGRYIKSVEAGVVSEEA